MNYSNYLMLGLDQAKCLYKLLFISLIARSSPKAPPWAVIKEPFMKRRRIQLESEGTVFILVFEFSSFFFPMFVAKILCQETNR